MSKKLFLICLVALTFSFSARSQYVTIPDSVFAQWLQVNYPSCMMGNQMDTNCYQIYNDHVLNVSGKGIHDLTGIQYFKNLWWLYCNNNNLTTLPTLPISIAVLECKNNLITVLPDLPDSLRTLYCGSNSLTSLPSLPNYLTFFDCSNNQLTSLPPLPNQLKFLFCDNNNLTSLPTLPASLKNLLCSFNQLISLPTLPFELHGLDCRNNQITNLPVLPDSLRNLSCYENSLTSLPTIPDSLEGLDAGKNNITSWPTLPNGLITLYINRCNLTTLPILPNNLRYFQCNHNSLTSLPAILPDSLRGLIVDNNQLSNLPALPNALNYFWCYNNLLTNLPVLPNSLSDLSCEFNQLINLPTLPNSLSDLSCNGNQLTNLPTLPNSLIKLNCRYNQLTSLPELPNTLEFLNCEYNNISCFPVFPNSMDDYDVISEDGLFINGNPFTCLPNYVGGMSHNTLAFPLCESNDTLNNPYGCSHASGIFGKIFKDNDSNCIMSYGDVDCLNIHLKLYDSFNNLIAQTYSLPNGVYNFIDTVGTYRVELDTVGVPFLPLCTSPGIDSTIDITSTTPYTDDVNFGIVCKPGFDIGVQSVATQGLVFPGLQYIQQITAGDMTNWYNLNCTAGISGQVQLTVNGPVVFDAVPPGALIPTILGNVFTYNISDFGLVDNMHDFGLLFKVDTNAQSGDSVCVNAVVTPTIGDYDLSNNTYHFCYPVWNSYDPNMKEVYPVDVRPGFQDYLTYTIHFQNTGTAPAINIKLVDTLSNNLDMETFELINYSHYTITNLNGNVLTVRFPNIQLPDSATDQEGSKGFVQYRIKPKASWAIGSVIKNTAWIYFDYNAPIATNTTINEYITTGINENEEEIISLKIYPNPFNAEATVQFNKKVVDAELIIFDILGQKLKAIDHISGDKVIIDRGNISNGIYFIRLIQDNKIISAGKLIITG